MVSVHTFYFKRHNDPITIAVGDDDVGVTYIDIVNDCEGATGNGVDDDGNSTTGYDDNDSNGCQRQRQRQ